MPDLIFYGVLYGAIAIGTWRAFKDNGVTLKDIWRGLTDLWRS